MKIDLSSLGRRVFPNTLVLATTLVTCVALQADDRDGKQYGDKAHPEHADKSGSLSAEKFVEKATASGQMEVEMGRLGQQHAQNQEVKNLAAALVRDHTQANQKLQQIASTKNLASTHKADEQGKHQKHLDKLKSQSGAQFDKEFVKMALSHHKKDIATFEKAQNQVNDQELKGFITETLPKLRQHLQMSKAAARAVGVDEASIAEMNGDEDASAAGAAAGAVSGSLDSDKPRSSLDGATDIDSSGTINQNNPSLNAEGRIGDKDVSVNADNGNVDVDHDGDKIFQKGDGKVLGLPTSKSDGKFLGVIPNPRSDKDKDNAEIEADVDADADDASVGGSAKVDTGSSKSDH